MMQKHPLYERFLQERVVAILRGLAPENAVVCGDVLFRAGIKLLEVPLNRPGALESIRLLTEHFRGSGVHVGAGTVLAAEEVELVREAGGEFILSPNARSSVIRRTKELGLLSMPGFATPGEAFDAVDAGADLYSAKRFAQEGKNSLLTSDRFAQTSCFNLIKTLYTFI